MAQGSLRTPLGSLTVTSADGFIERLEWRICEESSDAPEIVSALDQLAAYFAGELAAFDLPLRVRASAFQQAACEAMLRIPYGETRTYGDLATELAAPAQAVGGACGGNPIPVIIPCHRVLGAASLGGYSGDGGVETKVWLLKHEGAGGLLI